MRFLLITFIGIFIIQGCVNSVNKSDYYDKCISQAWEINEFTKLSYDVENLFVEVGLLISTDVEGYLNMIERASSNEFENIEEIRRALKSFEDQNQLELQIVFWGYVGCLFSYLIENKNSLQSTSYLQFLSIDELKGEYFNYPIQKAMVKYANENQDFDDIHARIPIILTVACYFLTPSDK